VRENVDDHIIIAGDNRKIAPTIAPVAVTWIMPMATTTVCVSPATTVIFGMTVTTAATVAATVVASGSSTVRHNFVLPKDFCLCCR
jgi:hypothetical protein